MSLEEVRELIDSIVKTNSVRAITGQNLNGVLNEMLDYSAYSVKYVNQDLDTEEQGIARNNINALDLKMVDLPANLSVGERALIREKLGAISTTDIQDLLDNKVDKEAGKGLSTNDFTNALLNKLQNIEDEAQKNVKSDWNATSGDAEILNIPTQFPPTPHSHPISDVIGLQNALNLKLEENDLDGFVYNIDYNNSDHILTFFRQNEPNVVVDLPIESLIENIDVVGNDLVITFEDGTVKEIPLNTLLVGVVKSVNGLTPNSQGEIVLQITDIPGLQSALDGKVNLSGNNATGDLSSAISMRHNPVSLGVNQNGLSLLNQVLSLALSSAVSAGAMSSSQFSKLQGIEANANNYTLPIATSSVLGGVRVGSGLSIDSNGLLSNNAQNVTQVLGISGRIVSLSNGGGSVNIPFTDWEDIPNRPSTFPPSAHTHTISQITGLQAALDSKSDVGHTHSWGQITDKPTTFAPSAHNHPTSQINALTGYTIGTNTALSATDTLNTALGKIQAQINSKTSNLGTVTAITAGTGLSGGTINTNGTIALNPATIASLLKADSALQSGSNISLLNNDAGYITADDLPDVSGYLPLSGGTMTGVINFTNNNYGISRGNNLRLSFTSNSTTVSGNNTGTNPGIILRPQGSDSTAGQVTIQADGQINTANHGDSSQWKQSYDWGNHASAGYLTNQNVMVYKPVNNTPYSSSDIISNTDFNELPKGNYTAVLTSTGNTNIPANIGVPRGLIKFGANHSNLSNDIVIGVSGMSFRNGSTNLWRTVWTDTNFNPAQYVLQTSLNTQLENYVTVNSSQSITGTKTFTVAPIVPNGTLNGHTVNLGQLNDAIADIDLTGYATETWVTSQGYLTSVSWSDVSEKPTSFPPSAHTHSASDINSGTFAVARIPNLPISKITNLQGELDNKANYYPTKFLRFNSSNELYTGNGYDFILQKYGSGNVTLYISNGIRNAQRVLIIWGGTSNFDVQADIYDANSGTSYTQTITMSSSFPRLELYWDEELGGAWWIAH